MQALSQLSYSPTRWRSGSGLAPPGGRNGIASHLLTDAASLLHADPPGPAQAVVWPGNTGQHVSRPIACRDHVMRDTAADGFRDRGTRQIRGGRPGRGTRQCKGARHGGRTGGRGRGVIASAGLPERAGSGLSSTETARPSSLCRRGHPRGLLTSSLYRDMTGSSASVPGSRRSVPGTRRAGV